MAGVLFGALYSPLTASLVPALIARAEQNDFQNLLALAYADEAGDDNMSVGMQLSVLCSEDATRVTTEDVDRQSAGTVFGLHLLRGQLKACEMWPRGDVDDSYFDPVTSDVPALVLSGDLDPVTPPGWGDAVATHLKRARHITVPATGHGVLATPCGQELITALHRIGQRGRPRRQLRQPHSSSAVLPHAERRPMIRRLHGLKKRVRLPSRRV